MTKYPKPCRLLELDSGIGEINGQEMGMLPMDHMDEEGAKRQLGVTTLHGVYRIGIINLLFLIIVPSAFDPLSFVTYAYGFRYHLRQETEKGSERGGVNERTHYASREGMVKYE